jgi:hypothetical protein
VSPLPSDHPFYAVIGQVAAEWSMLEHILDFTIWDLSGMDHDIGACITAQMLGSTNRFRSIIALSKRKQLSDKIIKEATKLMRVSHDPGELRNRIVHDSWYSEEPPGGVKQFRAMAWKDPRFGLIDIDKKEIDKLVSSIRSLQERCRSLRNFISGELQSLQQKHPEQ